MISIITFPFTYTRTVDVQVELLKTSRTPIHCISGVKLNFYRQYNLRKLTVAYTDIMLPGLLPHCESNVCQCQCKCLAVIRNVILILGSLGD